ncbi:MAG: hypothetical protein A3C30_04700 [Candidatus Levybacteria bacterium RIFCSPHIGHO2_02_FULL_40_18]|nr:MAG: hypothetical protein A2869_02355 [Candidatus Levybacteria bacterium RIFCSPHIGHO2_01_FULL_40_58]OGH26378.1 MAG: hypothetical protein A3C30_04700 [Candidatus Levybacteria bacterium RIFCSPHIGHO2_02_FULL_40_18]OGH31825.1 MAG: hypothetical protein A3E43_00495 [Candidatus Levybacteria bacterium RIFCSPHIGHO2_12_FULL_40_31]OGH40458.1 MAG: hypothetical protein A2894_01000 [Candidatus Levybacteria bacterium RIFCSPLOWO2_01_FULL_40_64]OGH49165.1 MAG: hypothetical protein A3I54_04400 [Candidatus Lev
MISMRRNQELFWLLEILLLTPVALFWMGVVSLMLGSGDLFNAVVGQPYSMLKAALVTLICPAAAAWFAIEYLRENKREKGSAHDIATAIIGVSLATIGFVLVYLFVENRPR